jgi:hypothetical protein
VDAYDISLVRTTPTALSVARENLAATSVGNYALFGGGFASGGLSAVVDAYNPSLVRTTPTALSEGRHLLAASKVGNYALFGGGSAQSGTSSVVDTYDTGLTRTVQPSLSAGRYFMAATKIGNYALFGGGFLPTTVSAVSDAYAPIAPTQIPLTVGSRYQFFPATTETLVTTPTTITLAPPVIGYVKYKKGTITII